VGLSTLFAFVRGVIREVIALIAWVVGIVAAFALAPQVSGWLPTAIGEPILRYAIAFVAVLIGALLLGALIAWPLAKAVRAAGLGFVDRFLGSIFGLVRGLLVVVAFALVAGLTDLPRTSWWQDSMLGAPVAAGARAAAAYLPQAWADALDYSGPGRRKRSTTLKA
jgi:membrane protein required for colicin V production